MSYALNHITAPYADFETLAQLAQSLGLTGVEIRNDLDGVPIADGTPARQLRDEAQAAGIAILSINALQRFDRHDAARGREAVALARYAAEAGVADLVLCPTCDPADARSEAERARDLRHALRALAPVLEDHGLRGLVEPLGFAWSALRLKRQALAAIDETGTASRFALLHDSFHHAISGETELFAARTGLVHLSGVERPDIAFEAMRDADRVLVGPADRLDNIGQMRALRAGGYAGACSIEAFSPEVHDDPDHEAALAGCLRRLREG